MPFGSTGVTDRLDGGTADRVSLYRTQGSCGIPRAYHEPDLKCPARDGMEDANIEDIATATIPALRPPVKYQRDWRRMRISFSLTKVVRGLRYPCAGVTVSQRTWADNGA